MHSDIPHGYILVEGEVDMGKMQCTLVNVYLSNEIEMFVRPIVDDIPMYRYKDQRNRKAIFIGK
tara:strand:- start:277 stop:468 length:192 start_codon:yes stop_codon:yes gene_type:complete